MHSDFLKDDSLVVLRLSLVPVTFPLEPAGSHHPHQPTTKHPHPGFRLPLPLSHFRKQHAPASSSPTVHQRVVDTATHANLFGPQATTVCIDPAHAYCSCQVKANCSWEQATSRRKTNNLRSRRDERQFQPRATADFVRLLTIHRFSIVYYLLCASIHTSRTVPVI